MDPNHPNYALGQFLRRRGPSRQHLDAGQGSTTGGQAGHPSAQISHATMHTAGLPTTPGVHPNQSFYYTYGVPPQGNLQGLIEQPVPTALLYYPPPGHALSSAIQMPSSPLTSSAPASGSPASPVKPKMLISGQSYPRWDAGVLPGTMYSTSAARDEREGHQRVIQGPAPTTAATGSDVGVVGQQQQDHIGNSPYSLCSPQHQQLHRRVSSHLHAPTKTSAFVSYDAPSWIHQDLYRQAYSQQRSSYLSPESNRCYPHTSPTPMTFQSDLRAMQHERSVLGQFSHSMPSPAVPSPIQARSSPSAMNRFIDGRGMRDRDESITIGPTIHSIASAASSTVNPAVRMAPAYPLDSSGLPLNYSLLSPTHFKSAEYPSLYIPTAPTNELPSEPDGKVSSSPQATPAVTEERHQRREGNRLHKCPTCVKGFPRPSALKTHMTVHSGAKPYSCPIQTCNKSFTVRSSARRHLKTTHRIEPKTCLQLLQMQTQSPLP